MGQQIAYLSITYIGPASNILYGSAGDQVEILKVNYDGIALVKNGERIFHIKHCHLSFKLVEVKHEVIAIPQSKPLPVKQQMTKSPQQNSNQQTLF